MDINDSIEALSALAQPTRLQAFQLVVSHEPDGLPAGEIARALDVPQNTMSVHLGIFTRSGLMTFERQGRSLVYRADLNRFRELTLYLLKDCCGGRADVCTPLIAELTPCCSPSRSVS